MACCTVERLMRELGITGAVRGKKIVTTASDELAERAPDDWPQEEPAPDGWEWGPWAPGQRRAVW